MKDNNAEDNGKDEDSKESGEEDPMNSQTGKDYTPKTVKGKEMASMHDSFCRHPKSTTVTIVVYFGVSTINVLADFHEEHWKETFV